MKSSHLFLASLALAVAAPSNDTSTVCKYLYAKYPQYVAFNPLGPNALLTVSNASTYNNINNRYWNVENSNFYQSACIFFPGTAEQVSDAVKTLNQYPKVPFGLKSGGHNPAPGFSATKDGVLISFEPNLASTVRSNDGKHFVVGVGARWGDVYNKTGETNQLVVGGRLGDVGVAGLLLGGGLSYLSSQYGLACDNVDSFEAVLANGTIVNANRTSNPDLWWALRGGGNQFAIITRVTLQAHPAGVNGQVWGGTRSYSDSQSDAVFRALANFTRDYPDIKAAVIPTVDFILAANLISIIEVFFFYDGPTPPAGIFDDFDAIKASSDATGTKSYYELATAISGDMSGFGNSFRTSTFPNLPTDDMAIFYSELLNLTQAKAFGSSILDLPIQVMGFDPQPLPAAVARASVAQGGNALGLDPDHGDRVWIEHEVLWLNQLCNKQCPQLAADVVQNITTFQKANFAGMTPTNYKSGDVDYLSYNPKFMNDAAPDQQIYGSYPPANLARLQAIKAAYDPTGFFTSRQGGFKLP